jgi:hypothetical protein
MNDSCITEELWQDLLDAIDARQVIPILGEGVVTVPAELGGGTLNDWLAGRLAEELGLSPMPMPCTLNGVASTWLMSGGKRQSLYNRLGPLLARNAAQLVPPPSLLDLAAVRDLSVFVSTTFDSLLVGALNAVRHAGDRAGTSVAVYHPAAHAREKDTPRRKAEIPGASAVVAQLMGRASTKPDYAVWDEDLLEFTLGLHRDLAEGQMPNLAYDLQDNHLLFLGLGFSDWLTRFFVRVAQQRRLVEASDNNRYLAMDRPPLDDNLVMFFNSLRQETQVWPCKPADFCAELRRRWEERHGSSPVEHSHDGFRWPERNMRRGAVFISYAREDIEAVKRLKTSLEAGGCDVWFDLERLQAGENWRNSLEDEVTHRCSIFISIISSASESRAGVVHEERSWAEVAAARAGADIEFYVPVIIDDTAVESLRRESRLHKKANIAWLPSGTVTPEFTARIHALQQQSRHV